MSFPILQPFFWMFAVLLWSPRLCSRDSTVLSNNQAVPVHLFSHSGPSAYDHPRRQCRGVLTWSFCVCSERALAISIWKTSFLRTMSSGLASISVHLVVGPSSVLFPGQLKDLTGHRSRAGSHARCRPCRHTKTCTPDLAHNVARGFGYKFPGVL